MKAMLLETDAAITANPLKMTELPLPQPGSGQVRVKVHMCGVCRLE